MNFIKSLPGLLVILGACFSPNSVSAQTAVPSGLLSTSQTWTAAGSPYIVLGDLTVPTGVTLTMNAGTVVHLGPGDNQAANDSLTQTELRIAGILNVNGLAGNPVLVRSGAASPAMRDFQGFVLLPGASVAGAYLHMEHGAIAVLNRATGASLSDLSLRNCGYGVQQAAGSLTLAGGEMLDTVNSGVYVLGGTLAASDLRIDNSNQNSFRIEGGDVTLDHSIITNGNGHGLYVASILTPNSVFVDHVSISGHRNSGVIVGTGNTTFNVQNSLITNNDFGIRGGLVTLANNLVWGNRDDYFLTTASPDSLSENPLLVDLAGGDFRPTSNSGLRSAGTDGQDIGAVAYDGVPTAGLVGHLFVNTVLTAATSPHVVTGDLTVAPGISLTVEPGAEVRFSANADQMGAGDDVNLTELRIDGGRLVADGTIGAPILFTATTNAPGAWYGIHQLTNAAGASIDHATIQYGRYGIESDTASPTVVQRSTVQDSSVDGLYFAGRATLTELVVRDNAGRGIFLGTRASSLTRSLVFDNGGDGVTANNSGVGSPCAITNNTVVSNGREGIFITGPSSFATNVRNNIIVGNATYGISRGSGSAIAAAYNLVWGNSTNYGAPPGSRDLSENPLFVNSLASDYRIGSRSPARQHGALGVDIGALPFDGTLTTQVVGHLYEDTVLSASASPHRVIGDLTVEPGVTLTIEPGAELRFAAGADLMNAGVDLGRAELRVLGTLVADGTSSRRINLTSDAAGPARGDWYGVHLITGANSLLDFVTVEYAYHAVHSSAPSGTVVQRSTLRQSGSDGLYVDGGSASYDQLTIRDSGDSGVRLIGAAGSLTNSQVFDNASHGIIVSGIVTSNRAFNVVNNTIVGNGGRGISVVANNFLTLTIRDNMITNHGDYAIHATGSVIVIESYNLVWGSSGYFGVNRGPNSFTENPLYANRSGKDFRITSRSGARFAGSTGGDLGALPFDGTPTVGEMGHLYVDTTWPLSASPIMVLGTITVEPGVTLSIEAGVDVRVAAIDAVGSNNGATQLRVAGRLLVNGTPGARVTIRSASPPMYAFSGEWSGITLLNSAANSLIQHAHILHAFNGIESYAPASNVVRDCEFETELISGINVRGGDMTFDRIYVHDSDNLGIAVSGGTPTFNNLVVTRVLGDGVVTTADVTINHATLDNCGAAGIEVVGNAPSTINVTNSSVTNNAFYGISSSNPSAVMNLGINNSWGNPTNILGFIAPTGTLSVDPMYANPTLGNYQLQPGSPLIDAADPTTSAVVDFEGTIRPIDGDSNGSAIADLGALEFNPNVNRPPVAAAGPDLVVTSGQPVIFDGSGSTDPDGTVVGYAWDFGDGSTANTATVTHTFAGSIDRTVTLTVTDNDGAVGGDSVFVEVNLAPIAQAGPTKFGDPGETISFGATGSTDNDGTIVTYAWDYGDGTAPGTGANATHQYNTPGIYTVTLTVTDDDGATGTDTTSVTIFSADAQPPTIAHTPLGNGQPAGQPVSVTADLSDTSGIGGAALWYRAAGAPSFVSVSMSNSSGSTYVGIIPASTVTALGVEYYISATDNAVPANTGALPAGAPTIVLTFTVVLPPAPVIVHTPMSNVVPEGLAVTLTANITAPAGLTSATLLYRTQGGGVFTQRPMTNTAGSTYEAQIAAPAVLPPAVEYYFEAVDTVGQNTPDPSSGGVYAFPVTPADRAGPSITHVPVADGQLENQPILITAGVTDASGVAQVDLHYRVAGMSAYVSVAMSNSSGTYSASIPAAAVTTIGVQYYLSASDTATPPDSSIAPATAPSAVFSFSVHPPFTVGVGDLIITEIMVDPTGSHVVQEWFEVYNTTPSALDLNGFRFSHTGTQAFTVNNGGPLMLSSAGYLVLGRSADSAVNGGVAVDYVYRDLGLGVASDTLTISAGPLVVDLVPYDAGATFPRTPGHTLSLAPQALDAIDNDLGANWCAATTLLSGGDFGTPGQPNDTCLDTTPPQITHTPITDGQAADAPVIVSAVVTDNRGLAQVELYYRALGVGGYTSIPMSRQGGDTFEAEIPAAAVTTAGVVYYIRAQDAAMAFNETFAPTSAPNTSYSFGVTVHDTAGPAIAHTPVASPQSEGTAVPIVATVVDAAGVRQVDLHYREIGGFWQVGRLSHQGQGVYTGEIRSSVVMAVGVEYYLTASDELGNTSAVPEAWQAQPYTISVVEVDTIKPLIVHTPVANGPPAGQAISVAAQVTDASGIAEVRLHLRAIGTSDFMASVMTSDGPDGFRGEIAGEFVSAPGVEYYLEAIDQADEPNLARNPQNAPEGVHRFAVTGTTDTNGPSIAHQALDDGQPEGTSVTLAAEVTDPSGVTSVKVFLRRRGDSEFTLHRMARVGASDRWSVDVPGISVRPPALEYYVEAVDGAGSNNSSTWPANAPDEVLVFTITSTGREGDGCSCTTAPLSLPPWQGAWLLLLLVGLRFKSIKGQRTGTT